MSRGNKAVPLVHLMWITRRNKVIIRQKINAAQAETATAASGFGPHRGTPPMAIVVSEMYGEIVIPAGITDVTSFLKWIDSADLPEKLPVSFIRGEVRVDLAMEELFSHNQIKTALGITLGGWIEANDLGFYVTDGMLLVNKGADLATEPDSIFISHTAVQRKDVEFAAGRRKGAVATRIVGSPDLVVEILSRSSEAIDTEWLMSAYHNAGVAEYWVIDARGNDPEFVIYQRRAKEFVAARTSGGWTKSPVLGKSFRLVRKVAGNYPRFKLEIR